MLERTAMGFLRASRIGPEEVSKLPIDIRQPHHPEAHALAASRYFFSNGQIDKAVLALERSRLLAAKTKNPSALAAFEQKFPGD